MKNHSKKIIFFAIVFSLLLSLNFALAQLPKEEPTGYYSCECKTATQTLETRGKTPEEAESSCVTEGGEPSNCMSVGGPTAPTVPAKFGLEEVKGTPRGEIIDFVVNVMNWLVGIVGIALIVMIIWGGFLYLTSAGNEEQIETAKKVITYAIVGVVFVFASYIITRFVIQAVTGGGKTTGTEQTKETETTETK